MASWMLAFASMTHRRSLDQRRGVSDVEPPSASLYKRYRRTRPSWRASGGYSLRLRGVLDPRVREDDTCLSIAALSQRVQGLALVWKTDELADGVEDVLADTPGRKNIVLSDEFPDIGDIDSSAGV